MLFPWGTQLVRMADRSTKLLREVHPVDVLYPNVRVGVVVRKEHEGPLFQEYFVVDLGVYSITWAGDTAIEVTRVEGARYWDPMNVVTELHVYPPPQVVALPEVSEVPLAWDGQTAFVYWREE